MILIYLANFLQNRKIVSTYTKIINSDAAMAPFCAGGRGRRYVRFQSFPVCLAPSPGPRRPRALLPLAVASRPMELPTPPQNRVQAATVSPLVLRPPPDEGIDAAEDGPHHPPPCHPQLPCRPET